MKKVRWPVRPPGTILIQTYLRKRLRSLKPGRFIEVGCGNGQVSNLLLQAGWTGVGYDLNRDATETAANLNMEAINVGTYDVRNLDWLLHPEEDTVDLVISCMVLEHMDDAGEGSYLEKAQRVVGRDGLIVLLVPSSPAHWSIEDEIAGHYRRYDRELLTERLTTRGWTPQVLTGLTYPLSNLLLPLARILVQKSESHLKEASMQERTKRSGHRDVAFKTKFPPGLRLILNEYTMYPLHLLQVLFSRSENAMVLYCEARRADR